ncbi:branched-chain amino acid ABC transporter permease, partial [Mesorhizobium sp. M7A.T.Ca.TU.009.02.1.1]
MTAITSDFAAAPVLPKWVVPVLLLAFAYGVVPLIGSSYLFEAILLPFLALS